MTRDLPHPPRPDCKPAFHCRPALESSEPARRSPASARATLAAVLLALALPAWAQSAPEPDQYPFKVENRQQGARYELAAINDGPAPVSISVATDGKNIASTADSPLYQVIPSYTTTVLAEISAADPRQGYSFRERHSWVPGDYTAQPDQDYAYRLPFADGDRFPISQADDGPLTTHKEEDQKYAVDFSMHEGELIVAAREGNVVAVQDGYTVGGNDPALLSKANSVRILHPDGGIAVYAHLQNGSIRVTPGEPVLEGQPLGRSGNTGYSTGPHLHFAVTEVVRDEQGMFRTRTIPITFRAFKPAVSFVPKTRHLAWANYTDPPPTDLAMVSPPMEGLAALPQAASSGQSPVQPEAPDGGAMLRTLLGSPAGRLLAILLAGLVALWWLRRRR